MNYGDPITNVIASEQTAGGDYIYAMENLDARQYQVIVTPHSLPPATFHGSWPP